MTKYIKWLVVVIAIATFCMVFGNQLAFYIGSKMTQSLTFQEVYFEGATISISGLTFTGATNTSILPFIGYCLVLFGGLTTLFSSFSKGKTSKAIFNLLSVLAFLVGAIFILLLPTSFFSANESLKNAIDTYNKFAGNYKASLKMDTCSIIGLILSLCAFVFITISFVLDLIIKPKKKRKRK